MPASKDSKKELRALVSKSPSAAVDILLDVPFWLQPLSTKKIYKRHSDDTDGYDMGIQVFFGGDGDAWVEIQSFRKDPDTGELEFDTGSHRFRTMAGGGNSLRVRTALMILARAIELDEKDRPDR